MTIVTCSNMAHSQPCIFDDCKDKLRPEAIATATLERRVTKLERLAEAWGLAETSSDNVGVWLCHLDRFVISRVGGPARYTLAVAEEIARVLTELGTDAEAREVPR